jgi:CheY-like chemotaxis protein
MNSLNSFILARGIDESLRTLTLARRHLGNSRPDLSQSLRDTGIAPPALFGAGCRIRVRARRHSRMRRDERTAGVRMPKASLISLVEDDQLFRESMGRLMRSLGYSVEAFPSAADFLASPRLAETACLIADVHMPAMTGIDLYRHLIEAGHAVPTILVTAYPDDADRSRALNDGVICYLRKPVDETRLLQCLRVALRSGEPPEENS